MYPSSEINTERKCFLYLSLYDDTILTQSIADLTYYNLIVYNVELGYPNFLSSQNFSAHLFQFDSLRKFLEEALHPRPWVKKSCKRPWINTQGYTSQHFTLPVHVTADSISIMFM